MSWTYDRSYDRIGSHLDALGEITVTKLRREANLDEMLSETECREIYGAHAYIQVTNFARLASVIDPESDAYRELVRAVHVYQRELGRLVGLADIDGLRVHFQGAKLHALLYRPIDDGPGLATRAVTLQLIVREFVQSVFNPALPQFGDFRVAGGVDLGDAIGTRNGARSDRELLFLGAPANYAAKIIGAADTIRLTPAVHERLPDVLRGLCSCQDGNVYVIRSVTADELDDVLSEVGISWDRAQSRERVDDDLARFALETIGVSGATAAIDLDALSIFDSKRVEAATLFADVSGFTAYVDAASTETEQTAALRVFHGIRREMARVIRTDFDGLRVQYQGDRLQGLFHLPEDDMAAIAERAVQAAIGLQSSMEITLKEHLPEASGLRLAIGIDVGTTLVTRLGTRAHRDRICLGSPVEAAAAIEERCDGGVIGVSSSIYAQLSADLQSHFSWDKQAQCYVAEGLTVEKLEATRKAKAYARQAVYVGMSSGGIIISPTPRPESRPVVPPKPWSSDADR